MREVMCAVMAITVGGSPPSVTQTPKAQQTQQTTPVTPQPDSGAAPSSAWGPKATQGRPADPVADKLAQLAELQKGHTDRGDEKKVLELFRGASPAELNG